MTRGTGAATTAYATNQFEELFFAKDVCPKTKENLADNLPCLRCKSGVAFYMKNADNGSKVHCVFKFKPREERSDEKETNPKV